MKSSLLKKASALFLAVLMILTMVPAGVFAAENDLPMIMAFNAGSSQDFHSGTYYNKIYTVTFLDSIDTAAMDGAADSWDISAETGSGEVMAWVYLNEQATAAAGVNRYDLYIAGEGGVAANPSSTHIFYLFNALEEVKGIENFRTEGVTNISFMFGGCKSLKSIDLSSFDTSAVTKMESLFRDCNALVEVNLQGFDTSNVTSMAYMFSNCVSLPVLDLSGFDTRKVTNMDHMFYRCMELTTMYAGDNWNTDAVTNSNAMFNCCYVIKGDKAYGDYYKEDKTYATTDGGYLTYKAPDVPKEYTVTYSFTGDIPEGVTPPANFKYNEGSKIKVEDTPKADGYVFSGWTTTDAVVENGEFTVNNDVHFVGSWSKLYTVTYKYAEGYEVPADAPELPAAEQYKAGDEIDVIGVPYIYRYVFIGWTTEDADVVGDMFVMPENDVVLYGYFKIPVESIEIMDADEKVVLNEHDTTRLNVYVNPEDATIKTVVYESGNPDVATVDNYGNIVAVGEGETTITVKSSDDPTKYDTITVKVKKPVTSIGVTPADVFLDVNDEEKKTATLTVIINEDATNKAVTFESADESIATVDENGKITAVGDGETIITVTSQDDPKKTVTIKVTVKTPVKELTVVEDFTMEIDEVKNVDAKVNEDATNKELIYETSDSSVAKVDSNGDVIAVGEGTATITVISKDNPEFKKEIEVTVYKRYNVTYEYEGEIPENAPELPAVETYKADEKVTVKAAPVLEGYEFTGWSTTDAEVADGGFTMPHNDVVLKGSFKKINYYDVTYRYEGEVPENAPSVPDKETYREGSTVNVKADAETEGYTFSGWSTEDAEVKDGSFEIYNNVEFVGRWEKVIVSVDKITVDKTEITLDEGEKDKITVTVTPDNATDPSVTYTSSDENVVKVDKDGNIEAVGEGEATITVKTNDGTEKEVTIKVTVEKPFVPVDNIIIEKSEIKLNPGDIEYIRVTVSPDNATNKEVTYTSSNTDVVTVDEKGNVTVVGLGTATITITSKDNSEIKKEITVTVEKPFVPVDGVEVDRETITIRKGETDEIIATVKPDDATNQELTYKSSNEDVVRVDENGNIEAVGEGRAIITIASKEDPLKRKQILVIVEKEKVPVTSVEASKEEMNLIPGADESIVVKVNPDDATNKEVTYTSSNPDVAKVDEKGKVVAVGEGEAIITITSKDDPTKTDTIKVVVKAPEEPEEPTDPEKPTYTIVVPDGMNIMEGESKNLGVTITPDDGTIKPVYKSSDEGIVTVDAEGNIKGIKAGVATITVDLGNGDIRVVPVVVAAIPAPPRKHHIAFGKTDGIGWYEVSVNGGDFFPQGPNSTLEVEEGSILVVRVQDMWIDDEFDFYVNGSKVPMDPANTITVVVDGYMLIGALSMDVEVPDVDESLSILEKITNFFAKIINWFKNLFK